MEAQTAASVLMVRPAAFGANPQTQESNRFQTGAVPDPGREVRAAVDREFDALAQALERAGVEVCIVADTPAPPRPDAVFPNNWFSTHADGTLVLYPMLATNRRTERRTEVLEALTRTHRFRVSRTVDLTAHEHDGVFLEGTGSLVLDRSHRLAYACLSARTHVEALGDFAQQLDYEIVGFEAVDAGGAAIYHTNVLMCVGSRFAVLCPASIADAQRRAAVVRILENSAHALIEITHAQMSAFAGNVLELRNARGETVIAMSSAAHEAFGPGLRARLETFGTIVHAPIPTIERYGGGSVRCMLAEIHLPRRA